MLTVQPIILQDPVWVNTQLSVHYPQGQIPQPTTDADVNNLSRLVCAVRSLPFPPAGLLKAVLSLEAEVISDLPLNPALAQAIAAAVAAAVAPLLAPLTQEVGNLTQRVGNLTQQVGNLTQQVGLLAASVDRGEAFRRNAIHARRRDGLLEPITVGGVNVPPANNYPHGPPMPLTTFAQVQALGAAQAGCWETFYGLPSDGNLSTRRERLGAYLVGEY